MADLRYPNYVDQGGTGKGSHTAYAVLCGGTTSTSELQSVSSVGTSGQVLTSGGASSLPSFQDATGGGSLVFLDRQSVSSVANVDFVDLGSYSAYLITWVGISPTTDGAWMGMQMSQNNGSTFPAGTYEAGCNYYVYNSTSTQNKNASDRWVLTGVIDNSNPYHECMGHCYIWNANSGSQQPHITGTGSYFDNASSSNVISVMGGDGPWASANAFRILMNTGNINAGRFNIYGVSKS